MTTEQKILFYFVVAVAALLLYKNWNKWFGSSFGTSTVTTTNTTTASDTTAQTVTALQVTNQSGATVYAYTQSSNSFAPQVPAQTVAYGTLLFFTNKSQRTQKTISTNLVVTYYQTSQGWVASTDVKEVNVLKHN